MGTFAFLGTPEVMIILVIALVVFGPEKLKDIGRQLGSAMREMRKMSGEVQRALDLDDFGSSGGGSSYYNGYEAGRWQEPTATITAAPPVGTVAAHEDPLAISAAEPAESGDTLAEDGATVAHATLATDTGAEREAGALPHPPGPPAVHSTEEAPAAAAPPTHHAEAELPAAESASGKNA